MANIDTIPIRNRIFAKLLFVVASLLLSSVQQTCANRKEIVDIDSDIKYGWKLKGDYIYFPDGNQLQIMSSKLPDGFKFSSISNTKGIWAIFPSVEPVSTINNSRFWTNEVSFSYSTSAQLLDSVTIRHNSGGQVVINIITNHHNYTQTPEKMFEGWIDITVPLEGTGRFTIEATASNEEDYILIDRIEATFVETTTSTRRPKTTTLTPTPQPMSGGRTLTVDMFLNILLIFISVVLF